MNFFRRCNLSALVMNCALFPPRPEKAGDDCTVSAGQPPAEHLVVNADNVRFYLADLDRAVNHYKELRLIIPGCFALAAPLLLFRLKRRGFSNSRAVMTDEGLLVAASR
jgi:hypothetical protein